jgi:hypothetical protein
MPNGNGRAVERGKVETWGDLMNDPTNLADAKKRRYGAWAGDPSGNAYSPERCAYSVWSKFTVGGHQCSRINGHGPAELYCRQHAKIMIERQKRNERMEKGTT